MLKARKIEYVWVSIKKPLQNIHIISFFNSSYFKFCNKAQMLFFNNQNELYTKELYKNA